jgi:hypothetical protein
MRVVLDTSVLVSAIRSKDGASNALLKSLPHLGMEPCLSVALYAEWQEVLCRNEHLPAGQTAPMRGRFFAIWSRSAIIRMCIFFGARF